MKRTLLATVSFLLLRGAAAPAGELSCNPGDPSDCTFTYKRVLFCQTYGVLDNGTCVNKATRLTATEAQCASLGYHYPSNYDRSGKPYTNYKLFTPKMKVPSNAECLPGLKRYWKYSCCRYRHCGDLVNTSGGIAPDGKMTASDLATLQSAVAGAAPLEGQRAKAADLNRDGELTDADVTIMANYFAGTVGTMYCPVDWSRRCKIPCGDANGDGLGLDIADLQAIVNWVNRFALPTRCQFWASDIDANGKLEQADLDAITQGWQNGETVPLAGCAQ
jgi:hypothetical protein